MTKYLVHFNGYNPFYTNITIDHVALQKLPCDAVPSELHTAEEEQPNSTPDDNPNPDVARSSHSLLPVPRGTAREDEAIRATFNQVIHLTGQACLQIQSMSSAPQDRDHKSSPHYGTGDPTFPSTSSHIDRCFKHLERYTDVEQGCFQWRFATHPRFPYWALTIKQRHQLISQASV